MCFEERGICRDCESPIQYKAVVNRLYIFSCIKCNWEGSDFKTNKFKIDYRNQENECHDCGIKEEELHKENCDMEICPFCGLQILSCGCRYTTWL